MFCLSLAPGAACPTGTPPAPHCQCKEICDMGLRRHLCKLCLPSQKRNETLLVFKWHIISQRVSLRSDLATYLSSLFLFLFFFFSFCFKCQYKEGKKLKPKPNYNSVDLSEVEWEDQDEIVSVKVNLAFLVAPSLCYFVCLCGRCGGHSCCFSVPDWL